MEYPTCEPKKEVREARKRRKEGVKEYFYGETK
jgi:hypothetical protein